MNVVRDRLGFVMILFALIVLGSYVGCVLAILTVNYMAK
jgi:hypothetical protein